MDNQQFVSSIKQYVREAAIEDTLSNLTKPPGRKPREKHLQQSQWYNQLSVPDKQMLKSVLEEAVDEAIFGFLAVLDGVRVIEGTDSETGGSLNLIYEKKGNQKVLNIPDEAFLHDLYNDLVQD